MIPQTRRMPSEGVRITFYWQKFTETANAQSVLLFESRRLALSSAWYLRRKFYSENELRRC